ncbi:hypothetical protein FISHEDRAFT_77546 [Fistulina hepatica ATCC 64428]|uniref:RNA polymerase II elongation factor ELL N-terminal domain-containing protein n=1 Tax=Fistulina hepatica ATCC 64428 TaxID=1128425 RepID=A0A0D7A0N2_9AGAR|nr:hypothetical protein FISHEDRAFT_77546 [Fistulina hepatica ATCC 64428]
MPLPVDVPLSIQPQLKTGEQTQAKPKQAMIVRLSQDTLDALAASTPPPHTSFEFGPNPKLHIGGSQFSLRPIREACPHEIYLQMVQHGRTSAPLKLYANVSGKFSVERQFVDEKLEEKNRESTLDAKKHRAEGRTTIIDPPAALSSAKTKKRKDPQSMFRNALKPSDLIATTASNPPPPRPVTSISTVHTASSTVSRAGHVSRSSVSSHSSPTPRPNANSSSTLPSNPELRQRVIIHIASNDSPSADEVVRVIGGPSVAEELQQDIRYFLEEVAEIVPHAPGKSKDAWRLKQKTWLETRPYEWPNLSDQTRLSMARSARLALAALKIPQSDPLWVHFRFRDASIPSSSIIDRMKANLPEKPSDAVRRGVSSKDVRDRNGPPVAKSNIRNGMVAKDETGRASTVVKGKQREDLLLPPRPGTSVDHEASKLARPVARHLPGSGYKAPSRPGERLPKADDIRIRKMEVAPAGHDRAAAFKRGARLPLPDKSARESSSSRERDESLQKREEAAGYRGSKNLKRKSVKDELEFGMPARASGAKRRKTNDGRVVSPTMISSNDTKRGSDGQNVKAKRVDRTTVISPTARKPREVSPLPTKPIAHKASSPLQRASPQKRRRERKEPVYTSTEDEADEAQPEPTMKKRPNNTGAAVPKPTKPTISQASDRSSTTMSSSSEDLRTQYGSLYVSYLSVLQASLQQKQEIERALAQLDARAEDSEEGAEDEDEMELDILDEDQLVELCKQRQELHSQLQDIQDRFVTVGPV